MKYACSLAVSVGLTVAAAAGSAAPLPPTAKWVVDYGEHQCVASRSYGSPQEPLTLAFKPSPMGEILQLTILEGGMGGGPQQVSMKMRIGNQPPIDVQALAFNAQRSKVRLFRVNLPIAQLDRISGAAEVSIQMEGRGERSFALSQMKAVAAELTRCVADLRNHWNIGPEHEAKFKVRSGGPNLATFFKGEDYPDVAIRNQEHGTVRFALLIDAKGNGADCTLIQSSKVPLLDAQSCAVLMSRAKLTPAVGLDGKPLKDARTSYMTWRL